MRRVWVVALCAACIGAGFAGGATYATRAPRARPNPRTFFRVFTRDKVVALTFDDGPDPRWTPTVLDQLNRFGVHATFFLVGQNALAHPDLVKAELDAGNQIGNHTLTHPNLEQLSPDKVQAEIEQGAQAIRDAGAPDPKLFRPPFGDTDQAIGVIADAHRYRTVFWDLAVEHYVDHQPVPDGVRQMLVRVRPGSIILAHDAGIPDRTRTMEALPMLLAGLKRQGYKVLTVADLLDHAQRQPKPPPAQ